MEFYNIDKIVKISVHKEAVSQTVCYDNGYTPKGWVEIFFKHHYGRKAGFYKYRNLDDGYYIAETLPERYLRFYYFDKTKHEVMSKPKVVIHCVEDYKHHKYFETYEQACNFARHMANSSGINCIEVE